MFTIVIDYYENSTFKHKSMLIISHNFTHDTAAVCNYQKIIVDYLITNYNPKRFIISQSVQSSILKTNIVLAIFKLTKQILVSLLQKLYLSR